MKRDEDGDTRDISVFNSQDPPLRAVGTAKIRDKFGDTSNCPREDPALSSQALREEPGHVWICARGGNRDPHDELSTHRDRHTQAPLMIRVPLVEETILPAYN